MHRGGTSAVAGMLHRLGVDFGPRLMPANADNPAGYYEHNDVVNLHDRFLGRLGAAWDDPFPPAYDAGVWPGLAPAPGLPTYREELLAILRRDFSGADGRPPAPVWGLKDPRLCLLLPWWAPIWAELDSEPCFLIVLRSPEAVAASLGRRDGFSTAKSGLLWLQHVLRAERGTRGARRCFVDYDCFLADWRSTLERVGQTFGLSWPRPPASLSPGDAAFLDPALRHHGPARSEVGGAWSAKLPWLEAARAAFFPVGPDEPPALDLIYEEMGRAGTVFNALADSSGSDFNAQIRAQRRLTRWYEEEWQKADRELEAARQRLAKKEDQLRALHLRPKPRDRSETP